MRYVLIILVLGAFACGNDREDFNEQNQKIYKLRAVNSGFSGQIIYERGLEFRETVTLNKDSTFFKERIWLNDTTMVSSGSYSLVRNDSQDFFRFDHNTENELIQNCSNELVEFTVILDDKNIYNGTSIPCDGPGYSYERIQ